VYVVQYLAIYKIVIRIFFYYMIDEADNFSHLQFGITFNHIGHSICSLNWIKYDTCITIFSFLFFSYNSSFSFTPFNANLVDFPNRRSSPYCFKIQGQIYYQINTALYAAQNQNPTYDQLFIIDSNEAINYRFIENSELDLEIIQNFE